MKKNPARTSVMKHQFSRVPKADIPRSSFDRTHGHKTTIDAGKLIPFYCDEALPGDTFNVKAATFARLNTPLVPFMDNVFMDTHYFAVPLRLLWDNFQKFMGEQTDPGDSTDFLTPIVTTPVGGHDFESLYDYMGIPPEIDNLDPVNFHGRAYNLIWNEWFRDQNLQDSLVVDKDDGPDLDTDYIIQLRGKRHDYFTSCLPFPQKGPGVEIPLGDSAPILGIGKAHNQNWDSGANTVYQTDGTGSISYTGFAGSDASNDDELYIEEDPNNSGFPNIRADLSNATAATINSLREAFQLQKLYERDARGGTRYTEIVRSHFGTVSPDSRLQRPEYLGGSTSQVSVTPVPMTAQGSPGSPKGGLAGFGVVAANNQGFTKSFTEHCVIIGLVSVRADLTYQTGMRRMFSRRSRFDYYWPALAHLGEQEVLNKEIWADGSANDDLVFGYQERWAEYRYFPSLITGKMRSTEPTSLDIWHLSQDFLTLPLLNDTFIEENPPIDRIVATPTQPDFTFDCYMNIKCARPMPVYSVPGLIDHF